MPSELNVADVFTKNLDSVRFTELQKKLMVHPRYIKLRVLKSEVEFRFLVWKRVLIVKVKKRLFLKKKEIIGFKKKFRA
jgi:hypothetical protein